MYCRHLALGAESQGLCIMNFDTTLWSSGCVVGLGTSAQTIASISCGVKGVDPSTMTMSALGKVFGSISI